MFSFNKLKKYLTINKSVALLEMTGLFIFILGKGYGSEWYQGHLAHFSIDSLYSTFFLIAGSVVVQSAVGGIYTEEKSSELYNLDIENKIENLDKNNRDAIYLEAEENYNNQDSDDQPGTSLRIECRKIYEELYPDETDNISRRHSEAVSEEFLPMFAPFYVILAGSMGLLLITGLLEGLYKFFKWALPSAPTVFDQVINFLFHPAVVGVGSGLMIAGFLLLIANKVTKTKS